MLVRVWGARGSIATPGPETTVYGGNTSCVEVRGKDGSCVVLDAGTGLLRLSGSLPRDLKRVDVVLTHLHMDHVQGLGFFGPLYRPNMEVHLWGPDSPTLSLQARLSRYLSPPLFPVHLQELPCDLHLHTLPDETLSLGDLTVYSSLLCHPGPTVGLRVESSDGVLAYIPDHEPALAGAFEQSDRSWISGYQCAHGADLLFHDAQYSSDEYQGCVGWGHSSMTDAVRFAERVGARHLGFFHHDPSHSDAELLELAKSYLSGVEDSGYRGSIQGIHMVREGQEFRIIKGEVRGS